MTWFESAARSANESLEAQGRRRSIRSLHGGGPATTLTASGSPVIQFASNDYLGLATHPAVAAAAAEAAARHGSGSGASRLVVGSRDVHDQLEESLAEWKRPELPGAAALLFATGYAANLGVLGAVASAVGGSDVVVLSDELNHASIIDGCRLARLPTQVYRHLDLDDLAHQLESAAGSRAVVVSDAVFSMDGDVLDVAAASELCASHDALLILDVAHDVFDVAADLDPSGSAIVVGTLSKSLGSLGGYIVAPRPIVDLVLNTARPFIFSTASPPPVVAGAAAALAIERGSEGRRLRSRLRDNIDHLLPGHPSPIIPVVIGGDREAVAVSDALLAEGLLVPAIRPPTVAEGTSRLRVALSALHTRSQLDLLADALEDLGHPITPRAALGSDRR